MKKYNVFSLSVIKIDDQKFICESIIPGEKYREILTGRKITLKDDYVVEKLSNASGTELSDYVVDILYKLPSTGWDVLNDYFPALESSINNTYKHIQNFNYF